MVDNQFIPFLFHILTENDISPNGSCENHLDKYAGAKTAQKNQF